MITAFPSPRRAYGMPDHGFPGGLVVHKFLLRADHGTQSLNTKSICVRPHSW